MAKTQQKSKPGMARHASMAQPKGGGARIALIAIGSILGILVVCYLAGVAAFSFVFMPNTTLSGADVSLKLASEVSSGYASKVGTYQVKVTGYGLDLTIRGEDIDAAFNESSYAQGLISQQRAWLWPLTITQTHELTDSFDVSFDEDKLREVVEPAVEAHNETATQPTNASVAYDEASGKFAVVTEQPGTAIDADAVATFLAASLPSMPASIALDESCLKTADVGSDNEKLQTAAETANAYLAVKIPLTLNKTAAGEVGSSQIAEWVSLSESLEATLDEEKIAEWVAENIAKTYDTKGSARSYTRPDGKQVTVEATSLHIDSAYGWTTDEASLVTALKEAIEAGTSATLEIPLKATAAQLPDAGGKDWGNRYIDIDLSEQHVRMYDDAGTLIWESDCVTGDHAEGHDTPTGVWQLNSNRASGNVELRGKIDPETNEPEYISYVDYWMPFIENSWALHDADWRSSFGGSIYLTNGSHGCVNLPVDKATELFGLCQVGDVVVVHY